ncbi:hypothetical protein E3P99_03313 [Wallemia hederae]|uniref:Mur ligase central domain-containing protein n=1 Tax=Wallemia hederae TaxID=1540922 RepID=A0A4T0FI77_9BASI|nr:hypothetical protein E3P99_03313 [Wallemia hederae]
MTADTAQIHLPAVKAGGRRISITRKAKRAAEIEEIEDVNEVAHDYPRPNPEAENHHKEENGYKNRKERRGSSQKTLYEPLPEPPAYSHANKKTMQIKQPAGPIMIKPGLEATARSLKRIQNQSTPIVHIAGTNGKGSTSAFVDALLASYGYRVGRFNSPHLIEERDSVSVGGAPCDASVWNSTQRDLLAHDTNFSTLTNFEKTTVTAFSILSSKDIDIAVVEVGMGGLLDATNAFERQGRDSIAVITPIALDHQSWLGDSIEEITKHKMGIVTTLTKAVVVAPQIHSVVVKIIETRCSELGVPIYITESNSLDASTPLKLTGSHQLDNASTALSVLRALKAHCTGFVNVDLSNDERVKHTLSQVTLRGRSDRQVIDGAIVDGAHNPAAIMRLRETLPLTPHTFILAFSQGKEVDEMLTLLARPHDSIIFVPFSTPEGMPWVKSMDTAELEERARKLLCEVDISTAENVQDALRQCQLNEANDVVIAGSLYLVADVYRMCS